MAPRLKLRVLDGEVLDGEGRESHTHVATAEFHYLPRGGDAHQTSPITRSGRLELPQVPLAS